MWAPPADPPRARPLPRAVSTASPLHTGWHLALCALAWLAGLAGQLQQPALWPLVAYAGLAAGAGLLVALAWRGPAALRRHALPLGMAAAAALAVGQAGLRADARLAERLAPALEGQDLLVTGTIATMPQNGPSGTRFQFVVERAEWRGQPVRLPPRLALGWYNQFNDEAWLDDPRADLRAGQRWRLPLRLKRPHASQNPHGFDAELAWFEQALGATGYVRVVRGWQVAEPLGDGWGHPIERLRQAVRDALLREVADARVAGVLAALVVGDQAAIELDTMNKVENWTYL